MRLLMWTHFKGAETARGAAQHGLRLVDVRDEAENTTLTSAMLICPWGSSAFHLYFISGDFSPYHPPPTPPPRPRGTQTPITRRFPVTATPALSLVTFY